MILYFTGTGNSEYVAKKIARKIDDQKVVNLGELIKAGESLQVENEEKLIFVYPTYAGRMPVFLSKYLLQQKFKNNANAFFVTTCGGAGGNQSQNLKSFCQKARLKFMNFFYVVMPENYIALFSAPSEDKAKAIINKANPLIDSIALKIASNLELKHITGFSKSPYNNAFYKIFVSSKGFHVEDTCVGCGKCADVCVLNNIEMDKDRPKWGEICTHCMACINSCPTSAIQYKNSTQKKRRYLFKDE